MTCARTSGETRTSETATTASYQRREDVAFRELGDQGVLLDTRQGEVILVNAVGALILSEPPSMADGEITAKGNLNFNRLQTRRAALVTRLYDWLNTPAGAMVKPKDPVEYIKKLRFHRQVRSASEYGLETAA